MGLTKKTACLASVRWNSIFPTTLKLSVTMKSNHGPKSKCQGIPFSRFTIVLVRFVTQLSKNSIRPANSLRLARIHWHSEQTDGLSPLSPCNNPPVLKTHTLTTFSQHNTQICLYSSRGDLITIRNSYPPSIAPAEGYYVVVHVGIYFLPGAES